MSSEVFFASTSISLRFRGRISRISLPRQSENDQSYYKAHKAEQVHRRSDDRDAVRVRVEPEPVADRRAVVGRENGRRRRYEPSQRADPDHDKETGARARREEGHGDQVRRSPDEHVHPGGEDVGEREILESRELRYPARRYEAEVDLRGETAGEDASEGAAFLKERRQKDAQGEERRELLLAVLQCDADENGHGPGEGQDRQRLSQDAPEVLDARPEAEIRSGPRRQ